ncbi:zinc finger protein ubi-d4 B-like isoform X2 [Anthonomus grandis grandis]|uniref:zinc finger protein ubi-d4 B-like isoform X2 n=1 Tax=Anthonomus grandis grandis TaxID=2921223 RepID=UPI002164F4FA|nr:zinc finger protein ubi-d4 B-like isoform X2 [Anthonomus grandis grandis]
MPKLKVVPPAGPAPPPYTTIDLSPETTKTSLEKIECVLNDKIYKQIIEGSANFNTRLCIERRLRLPFIDTQTGVAQNHCSLFMNRRQRLPGLSPGQIYSYPRQRWRKKRRQYLTMSARVYSRHTELLDGESDIHSISQIENPALQDTDSKDSQLMPGEVSKEWFYDEQDMLEMDQYDEPDADSDLDYEESYPKRRRGRKASGRGRGGADSPSTPGRKRGAGRGRGKKTGPGGHNIEPTPGDPDKPFACEICGARYKTRPGLTYHYRHSHIEGATDENSRDSAAPSPMNASGSNSNQGSSSFPSAPGTPVAAGAGSGVGPSGGAVPSGEVGGGGSGTASAQIAVAGPGNPGPGQVVYQDSTPMRRGPRPGNGQPPPGSQPPGGPPLTPSQQILPPNPAPPTLPPNLPSQPPPSAIGEDPPMPILKPEKVIEIPLQHVQIPPSQEHLLVNPSVSSPVVADRKVPPSPYCDFCLGDSTQNKKTGGVEELVSCHDCGRSGHPTCLQFTDNMKVSVKKYRWQCIECKCCSVCGTSDNDDQLLFCDDCDRGYHMYCLSPPLENPPEGSWSCRLCIEQFHQK